MDLIAGAGRLPPVDVVGVPLDLGAGRRGVDMGPSAIRYAGLAEQLRALGVEFRDLGNVPVPVAEQVPAGDGRARYAAEVGAVCRRVRDVVRASVARGALPLILGGDHSLSIGSLAGLLPERPDLKVIWIDAHGDLNSPSTTRSGNVHGMPLGVALGQAPGLYDELGWGELRLRPDQLVHVGVRSLDAGERELIARAGLRVYTMSDIDRRGLREVMQEAIERLAPGPGGLHVSFDADSVDPRDAPGVGTPVQGGLSFREAHLAMEMLAATGAIGSLEMVEINAIRDQRNATGELACGLILSALGKRIL